MAEAISDNTVSSGEVYGSFVLGSTEFAISALEINDVINAPAQFTKQPLAPDYMLGIFSLRGMTIPVIDLRNMFEIAEANTTEADPGKVAIIEYQQTCVGFLFDQTGEVFRAGSGGCEYGPYSGYGEQAVTHGAFRFADCDRTVLRLDAKKVIEFNGVPVGPDTRHLVAAQADRRASRGPKLQSISYRVGDCALAVEINKIKEIISVSEVENVSLCNELCLGSVTLRGQTVSLVNMAASLGLSEESVSIADKQVLVTAVDDELYGLVVDEILDIIHYYKDDILQFPIIATDRAELLKGALQAPDGAEVYQLDTVGLLRSAGVQEATVSARELLGQGEEIVASEGVQSARGEPKTYLTFYIDRLYAVQILDIIEVLDYPVDLLFPPLSENHVCGVIDVRGELVSVVNSFSLYGVGDTRSRCEQIIVFEHEGTRYGLAITNIRGITHVRASESRPLPQLMFDQESAVAADLDIALLCNGDDGAMEDLLVLDIESVGRRILATQTH
ncbi:MAG: chemotaxis protein CheW [Pseudomonadales bacterium]